MMPQIMRETFAGRVWTWRLATALLLAIVAWIPAPGRLATTLIFAVAAALLGLQSVTSHAVDKGAFAIAVHFAHEAAAGLWIGALVALLIGATYGHAGAEWLRAATQRVSKIAGWSVAALVVTGAIRAWDALGLHLDLLVNSIYGRTLLWKVGTAATVILIGGYNRYRLVGSVGESSARRFADSQRGRGMRSAGGSDRVVGSISEYTAAALSNVRLASNGNRISKRNIYMSTHCNLRSLVMAVVIDGRACWRLLDAISDSESGAAASVLTDTKLVDQNGNTISLSSLKGKPMVVDFIYTSCPGPCLMETAKLQTSRCDWATTSARR